MLDLDDGGEESFQKLFAFGRIFVEETGGAFDEQTLSFETLSFVRARLE